MAEISFYLSKRSTTDNSLYPLNFSIAHRGMNSFHGLGIPLPAEKCRPPTSDCNDYFKNIRETIRAESVESNISENFSLNGSND